MRFPRLGAIDTLRTALLSCAFALLATSASFAAMLAPPTAGRAIRPLTNPPWSVTVLYYFTSYVNGLDPSGWIIADAHGSLYGLAGNGGLGYGVVYRLTQGSSGWTESVLHAFSGADGASPTGNLVADAAGNLYGTTASGGANNAGTAFELSPSSNGWNFNVIHTFTNSPDGYAPTGTLVIDASGNLYGATQGGGDCSSNGGSGCSGTVFKLTPSATGWSESIIHTFIFDASHKDGSTPRTSLTADNLGNLYGTTYYGGTNNLGTIFRLLPPYAGRKVWLESVLHSFTASGGDGAYPDTPMVWNGGSLDGVTLGGGDTSSGDCISYYLGCGTVFQINRWTGIWTETLIDDFPAVMYGYPGPILVDATGTLYCPVANGLLRFNWTANAAGGGGTWVQRFVYYFPDAFGSAPLGLIEDAQGNLYATSFGGPYGHGLIYRINK